MQLLLKKQILQAQATKQLSLSERQVRNIFKSYKQLGDKGVVSKKLGKPSNYQLPEDLKLKALALIKTIYHDFGPTLAAEKLGKDYCRRKVKAS